MEKGIWDYYMHLNGIAYDPFVRDRRMYIRVAKLDNESEKAVFRVGIDSLKMVSSTLEPETMAQVRRDLPRNGNIIITALMGRGNLCLRISRSRFRRQDRTCARRCEVARLRSRADEERYHLTVQETEG